MIPILFIHSDPVLVKLYQTHFNSHFVFDSAYDGLAAIRKIRLNKPKIVVSDYTLPKLSGLGVLKFLRQHPELYPTPFIFLTNHHDTQSGLNHGANGWLKQSDTAPEDLFQHAISLLRIQNI